MKVFWRVTGWTSGLLACAVLLAALWFLPRLINLNRFRPQMIELLERELDAHVELGDTHGRLLPRPSLEISDVVVNDKSLPTRFQIRIHKMDVLLALKPLLQRDIRLESVEVQEGAVDLKFHTVSPPQGLTLDHMQGLYSAQTHKANFSGEVPSLGRRTRFHLAYTKMAVDPYELQIQRIDLEKLSNYVPGIGSWVHGEITALLQASFTPARKMKITMRQGTAQAVLFLRPVDRGPGLQWSGSGTGWPLQGSGVTLRSWTAKGRPRSLSIQAKAETTEGGQATIDWQKKTQDPFSTLNVTVSTIPIRQVMNVFHLHASTSAADSNWNPRGYEPWVIESGMLASQLDAKNDLKIEACRVRVNGMYLEMTGTIGSQGKAAVAHLQGTLSQVPVAEVVKNFFPSSAPLSGTGRCTLDITFPLSKDWFQALTGTVQVHILNGVLKSLETIYRVASVLNLSNFLSLRMPALSKQGLPFQSLDGTLTFHDGTISSEDLVMKNPDMNVTGKGTVSVVQRSVDARLAIQMLRFFEDIIRSVPGVNWIFKDQNKALLPMKVSITGPWDNVRVR